MLPMLLVAVTEPDPMVLAAKRPLLSIVPIPPLTAHAIVPKPDPVTGLSFASTPVTLNCRVSSAVRDAVSGATVKVARGPAMDVIVDVSSLLFPVTVSVAVIVAVCTRAGVV